MLKPVKFPKRQRMFEHLEPRNLLAGNVTADAGSGALIILGDGSANIITVTQTAPDTYKVAGTATKVNGSNSAQTFYATDGIFINLNGGNDVLTVKNLTINGESGDIGLAIMLGAGADVLLVQKVSVGWETAIDGGEGNNALVIDSCHLNYNLGIQTYAGVDAVTIKGTTILGALNVQLGNGTNVLTMLNDNVFQTPGGPDDSSVPEGFEVLECAAAAPRVRREHRRRHRRGRHRAQRREDRLPHDHRHRRRRRQRGHRELAVRQPADDLRSVGLAIGWQR